MPRDRELIDDARILPRFRDRKLDRPGKRQPAAASANSASSSSQHVAKAPGDPWALRGFPIVSPDGLGGAIPGTQPEDWILHNDPFD